VAKKKTASSRESASMATAKRTSQKVKTAAPRQRASPSERNLSTKAAHPASPVKKKKKKPIFRALVVPPAEEHIQPVAKLPTDAQLRKVKSGLARKDIQDFRRLLLNKRAEILGDMNGLQSEARTDSGDHLSPEHMADIGSNNFEQEFTLGLVESERRIVGEIDEALQRIANRTYGVCLVQAIPIGKARLDAKPWAKYCIEVVREKEKRGEL